MRVHRLRKTDARGFTLIELLVVIVIIGVLVALLLPAFTSVMDRSRATACVSNLRQIAVACNLYAAENNGKYPGLLAGYYPEGQCGFAGGVGNDSPTGPLLLVQNGYVKDKRIFFCPAEKKPLWFTSWDNAWGEGPNEYHGTYLGYRFYAGMSAVAADGGLRQDLTDLVAQRTLDSSNRILVTDICNGAPIAGAEWNHTRSKPTGGNILFNDGSVQWRKASDMTERYKYVNRSYYW